MRSHLHALFCYPPIDRESMMRFPGCDRGCGTLFPAFDHPILTALRPQRCFSLTTSVLTGEGSLRCAVIDLVVRPTDFCRRRLLPCLRDLLDPTPSPLEVRRCCLFFSNLWFCAASPLLILFFFHHIPLFFDFSVRRASPNCPTK